MARTLGRFSENIEENLLDPDEGNHMLCKACTLPIFSTPLYNENTDFPLHKDCANLPIELKRFKHPGGRPVLLKKSSPHDGYIKCDNCRKQCKGFIYQCRDSEYGYIALDVLCAVPTGTIKILHGSHMHELVPISSYSSFKCGVCESDHRGPSYLCNACDFWIHWDCALLPNKIQHKEHDSEHLLNLIYSHAGRRGLHCAICKTSAESWGWYFCTRCAYIVHIKCATSEPDSFAPVLKGDISLAHLPMVDEKTCLVRYLLQNTTSNNTKEKDSIHAEKFFDGKHDHPLIYHDHTSINDDHNYPLCNGCVKPISPPFYSCPECSDFFLHSCCANLPLEFQPAYFTCPLVLRPKTKHFVSKFRCCLCKLDCNGFAYTHEERNIFVDVECTFLPQSITHEAHPKSHILFLAKNLRGHNCQSCGGPRGRFCYVCMSCETFKLHVRCAKLPVTVTHKFDKHPLKLIFTRSQSNLSSSTKDDDYFCEFCERSINTNCWFYGCNDCSNWFHVDCIPSVRWLSKIKFGGTIQVPCHDCPLTSIRLLTEYSHSCGICQETIEGFEDKIAFECAKCNYRVHYDCAEEKWGNLSGAMSMHKGEGSGVDSELEDEDDDESSEDST